MLVEISDQRIRKLQDLANESGRSLADVLAEVLDQALPPPVASGREATDDWKPAMLSALAEIQAAMGSGPDDGFSGADHDDVLYPIDGNFR